MSLEIEESHRLQDLVTSVPRDNASIELTLWKSDTYLAKYEWRYCRYYIGGPGRSLSIHDSRLNAFGCRLHNAKWGDVLCKRVLDYIEHYEQSMPEERRELKITS